MIRGGSAEDGPARLDVAARLARVGGGIALEHWSRAQVSWKTDDSMVTDADLAIQTCLDEEIAAAFPDDGVKVAVPRVVGAVASSGTIAADVAPEASRRIGEITIALEPGTARTVLFQWGAETNFVHLHCPASGEEHPPGLNAIP